MFRAANICHAVVKFASDAASFFILQLEQACGKFSQILIRSVQVCGSFLNTGFEFSLRPAQFFIAATGSAKATITREENRNASRETSSAGVTMRKLWMGGMNP